MLISRLSSALSRKTGKNAPSKSSSSALDEATGDSADHVASSSLDKVEIKKGNFAKAMKVAATRQTQKDIDQTKRKIAKWIGEMERFGEALTHAPSIKNFVLYRQVLEKILTTMSSAYVVEGTRYLEEDGGGKEYLYVKRIDAELESLFELVKSRSQKPLKIAEKIIAINGLVLDALG